MTDTFDLRVERGDDPAILGLTGRERRDPSGFERDGFSKRQFRELRDCVRAGLLHAFRQAPESLLQFAPRTLRLYSDVPRRAEGARATTYHDRPGEMHGDYRVVDSPRGARVEIDRFRISPIAGISSSFLPGDAAANPAEIRRAFAHEAVHVLTAPGVRFSLSVDEAVACRLEETMFGPNRSARNDVWSEERMSSTCGLREREDFSFHRRPEHAKNLLYAAGPLALRFLTAEKIWGLCGTAVERAHEREALGGFADFREAAFAALGDADATRLMESMPVRPVEYGLQQFLFASRGRDRLLAGCFDIRPNPDYRYVLNGSMENYSAFWHAPPSRELDLRPHVRGMPHPHCGARTELAGQVTLDFAEIAQGIQLGTRARVRAADIERVTCELGIGTFDLLPPGPLPGGGD